MVRTVCLWTLALAAATLPGLAVGRSAADIVYVPRARVAYYAPVVSYYTPPVVYAAPAPVVSYYAAPAVSYYTPAVSYYAPAVSYYTPAVSYYTPAVSYYAPAASSTTVRYGPLGRPRVVTNRYYSPVVVGP
jgi:hypothetical protein